ncbi:MAG TPA: hypothetical protein DCZ12_01385 [Gammaproteobacteria bacterium]|nr:hypothetical protein [Gammaproteobacteria bacterium]
MQRFCFFLLLSIPLLASAQVYKWTDENGQVHYSQPPPPEPRQVEAVALPKSPPDEVTKARLNKIVEGVNERREDRMQTNADGEEAVERRKQIEAFCKQARKQKTLLQSQTPVSAQQADGTLLNISDEERAERLHTLDAQLAEFCQQ